MRVIALIILLQWGSGVKAEMMDDLLEGEAHFVPAGVVAGPTVYQNVVLRIDFMPIMRLATQANRTLEAILRRLNETMKNETDEEKIRVTNRVMHRLKPYIEELERAVGSVRQLSSLITNEKRSALLIAAAIGAIGVIGSAIYAAHEVKRLASEQARMQHHLTVMEAEIKGLQKAYRIWARKQFEKELEDEVVAVMKLELGKAKERVEDVLHGIYALKQHQLHPALVPVRVLKQIDERVKNYAKEKKVTPVFDLKTELLNLPVSYIQGKRGVLIVLHIPHVKDVASDLRNLYRLDTAILQGMDRLVSLKAYEPFISINGKWTIHKCYSEAELAQCLKVGTTYLCHRDTVLLKKVTDCTAALFKQETAAAAQHCPQETIRVEQPAARINATAYLVDKNQKTTLRCPGKKPVFKTYHRPEIVKMEEGCTLHSEDFAIVQPHQPHQEVIVVKHVLPAINVTLVNLTSLEAPMDELKLDMDGYSDFGQEEEESDGEFSVKKTIMTGMIGTVLSIGGILIVCLLVSCVIIYRRGRKAGRKTGGRLGGCSCASHQERVIVNCVSRAPKPKKRTTIAVEDGDVGTGEHGGGGEQHHGTFVGPQLVEDGKGSSPFCHGKKRRKKIASSESESEI